jgi:uncharacterized protein YecT (DUF1311 family)
MKKFLIIFVLILNSVIGFTQRDITKDDSIRIIKKVDKYILVLQMELDKKYGDDSKKNLILEFASDTGRIERIASEKMNIDYSTLGMSLATDELNSQYDKLLNKYYQKLLSKLSGSDKEVLKQAQRNWIQFRDNEMKLIGLLSEEKYSGGGTIQMNIRSISALDLTRKRVIELYQYLIGLND